MARQFTMRQILVPFCSKASGIHSELIVRASMMKFEWNKKRRMVWHHHYYEPESKKCLGCVGIEGITIDLMLVVHSR